MSADRSPIIKLGLAALLMAGLWAAAPGVAHAAQPDAVPPASYEDIQFILSTFSFLVWGALVMWMCATSPVPPTPGTRTCSR